MFSDSQASKDVSSKPHEAFSDGALPERSEFKILSDRQIKILEEYFDDVTIAEHQELFRKLFEEAPDAVSLILYNASQGRFGWSIETIDTLLTRFGNFSTAIVQSLSLSTPYYIQHHGEVLDVLKEDGSPAAYRLVQHLDREKLKACTPSVIEGIKDMPLDTLSSVISLYRPGCYFSTHPHETLQLIKEYGHHSRHFFERASSIGISSVMGYEKKHRAFLKEVFSNDEVAPGFGSLLEETSITNSRLAKVQEKSLELLKRYGAAVPRWYKLSKDNIFSCSEDLYDFLDRVQETLAKHDVEHAAGASFGALSESSLKHTDTIIEVLEYGKEHAVPLLELLTDDILTKHAETVSTIMQRCGSHAYATMRSFVHSVPAAVKEDTAFTHHILNHCGKDSHQVFNFINYYSFKKQRDDLMQNATRYGSLFGTLCHRWSSSVLQQEEKRRPFLTKALDAFGELTSEYLDIVTATSWESLLDDVVERHGAAAPRVLQAFSNDYHRLETHDDFSHYRETRARCFEEFGITHVERFVTIDTNDDRKRVLNDSLLKSTLENLDPEVHPERPIALVCFPESDHNKAFNTDSLRKGLHLLNKQYKLYIVESRTLADVDEAIKRFGSLHGIEEDDTMSRPLDLLVLCGHGSQYRYVVSTSLKRTSEDADVVLSHSYEYVTSDDIDTFKTWERYLDPDALVGLISCRVACGGIDGDNLATALHKALPGRGLDATRQASAFDRFLVDKDGNVSALHYASVSEDKVLRIRNDKALLLKLNNAKRQYEWHPEKSEEKEMNTSH